MKNLLIAFALIFPFLMNAQETIVPGVTVSGEGKVYVKPDIVNINIAIEHKGDYVEKIQEQTQKDVDVTLKFLKKAGIPEENIQTEYIRLNEQYQYNEKTYTYSSVQGISVKIEDMGKYEEIISGLMESGVNRINNIQFESSEIEKYEAQARAKAVKNAKAKAEQYAQALGQRIGKAKAIADVSTRNIPMYATMEYKQLNAGADVASRQTIAPGEIEVVARVTVNFSLLE
jgi:uncharacterized protein YggE